MLQETATNTIVFNMDTNRVSVEGSETSIPLSQFANLDVDIYNPNEQSTCLAKKQDLSNLINWNNRVKRLADLYAEKAKIELDYKLLKAELKDTHKDEIDRINEEIADAIDRERGSREKGNPSQLSLLSLIEEENPY